MTFLLPSGPHAIGSVVHELVDDTRPAHLLDASSGRRIKLKCWYPAVPEVGTRPEKLWSELRANRSTPAPLRLLLRCLERTTSTYAGAPVSPRVGTAPLVVYHHGLVSFAAENTSLAEELASHGSIVIALEHADQLAELRALGAAQSAEKKRADDLLAASLRKAEGQQRARLAVEYYEASENTNRIVVERAADTAFVLDRVDEVLARIPGRTARHAGSVAAHLVGFSVGGAVATEVAKRDGRAASVVNLDGGMHGTPGRGEVQVPYLMMYSAANESMNDALLPSGAQRVVPPGTAHLNYHDFAALMPGLRLFRAVGRANAKVFLRERNAAVRDFHRSIARC